MIILGRPNFGVNTCPPISEYEFSCFELFQSDGLLSWANDIWSQHWGLHRLHINHFLLGLDNFKNNPPMHLMSRCLDPALADSELPPLSLIITISYVFGNILTHFRYFSRYPWEVSSHHHPSNYYYIRLANKYLQSLSAIPAVPPPILRLIC